MGSRFAAGRAGMRLARRATIARNTETTAEDSGDLSGGLRTSSVTQHAGDGDGADNAEGEAGQHPVHAAAEHQAQHVGSTRAECHSETDLLSSLRHRVTHDPHDSHGGQQ